MGADRCLVVLLRRYEVSTKDVSKWQSIVKANREAPTLKFATGNEDVPRTSTTGALIAKFQPSRGFEKEIAAMLAAAGADNEQAVQEAEEALALKVGTLCPGHKRHHAPCQPHTGALAASPKATQQDEIACTDKAQPPFLGGVLVHAILSCCVAFGNAARAPRSPHQPACLSPSIVRAKVESAACIAARMEEGGKQKGHLS